MAKKIIISRRFRKNTFRIFQYLLEQFSASTADNFLERREQRIDFIVSNPEADKVSLKRKDVRSILFIPYNQIFYRYRNNTIEILSLFDMRKNPAKRPF